MARSYQNARQKKKQNVQTTDGQTAQVANQPPLAGEGIPIKTETDGIVETVETVEKIDAVQPASTQMEDNQITTNESQELPKIHLPGDEKFISYKNSLQCYCQKKRISVPLYKQQKEANVGLIGTVTFNNTSVTSTEIAGSAKEADARVAYDALVQLGYLEGVKFDMTCNQLKRKAEGSENEQPAVKRKPTGEPAVSKSRLNEMAQKSKFALPQYSCEVTPTGFVATVTFNGTEFKSLTGCSKRKEAEHNAAQVALNALIGAPLPESQPVDGTVSGDQTKLHKIVKPAPPLSLKNRLQEYCQKLGKPLPMYDTSEVDPKVYQTKVTVIEVEYQGKPVKGKKNAETSAAEAALTALELMVK